MKSPHLRERLLATTKMVRELRFRAVLLLVMVCVSSVSLYFAFAASMLLPGGMRRSSLDWMFPASSGLVSMLATSASGWLMAGMMAQRNIHRAIVFATALALVG